MRYLRIITIVVFLTSLLVAGWAYMRYYRNLNTDSPELTSAVERLQISVKDSPDALLQGLQAYDETDGDLTDQIIVASVSHFLEPGTVNVKYVVFDSHNNSASLTRQVHYTDYSAPRFSCEKAPVYSVGSSFDLLKFIRVEDCLDGDISDRVRVISNMVNNYAAGVYPVILEVSNSCGDTSQLTLWVTYTAKAQTAQIRLRQYIVYIAQDQLFRPEQWIASVSDLNGNPLSAENIEIQGNLDVQTPGFYQLVYSYTDPTHTGQTAITVVVTERQGANGR